MLNDKTVQAANFTCFHAGPMEGWAQYRLESPNAPVQMQGKLFLRNLLESAGLEMSLNVVPPGHGMPFLHKHRQNEEVYVVVGGRGQFLVDGECIDVAEGSVMHQPGSGTGLAERQRCPAVFPVRSVPGEQHDRRRRR